MKKFLTVLLLSSGIFGAAYVRSSDFFRYSPFFNSQVTYGVPFFFDDGILKDEAPFPSFSCFDLDLMEMNMPVNTYFNWNLSLLDFNIWALQLEDPLNIYFSWNFKAGAEFFPYRKLNFSISAALCLDLFMSNVDSVQSYVSPVVTPEVGITYRVGNLVVAGSYNPFLFPITNGYNTYDPVTMTTTSEVVKLYPSNLKIAIGFSLLNRKQFLKRDSVKYYTLLRDYSGLIETAWAHKEYASVVTGYEKSGREKDGRYAESLFLSGRYGPALECFVGLGTPGTTLYEYAGTLVGKGNLGQAEAYLSASNPDPSMYHDFGRLVWKKEGIKSAEKFLASGPLTGMEWVEIGDAFFRLNDTVKADAYYGRAGEGSLREARGRALKEQAFRLFCAYSEKLGLEPSKYYSEAAASAYGKNLLAVSYAYYEKAGDAGAMRVVESDIDRLFPQVLRTLETIQPFFDYLKTDEEEFKDVDVYHASARTEGYLVKEDDRLTNYARLVNGIRELYATMKPFVPERGLAYYADMEDTISDFMNIGNDDLFKIWEDSKVGKQRVWDKPHRYTGSGDIGSFIEDLLGLMKSEALFEEKFDEAIRIVR